MISSFLKVFDLYLNNDDRLGFLTFNESVKVIFEIVPTDVNKVSFWF